MPVAAGYASGTVQGAPDIDELARALDNDVDEIYKFVYENIEFLPTYGSQKGAWGTLVDGMGNSFDMSELMVELLRAAGYTATYMFGELELTEQEAADWFGTIDNNIWAARNLLSEGFIPNETFWTGTEWVLRLSHVWVKVDIGGTNYQFDPAKKAYSLVTGIDLGTAMSYNQTTFMSNATSGATITSDYVQDINRSNIRNDLDTYTSNLLAELKSNHHWKNVDQVLGGKTIVPVSGTVRQTSLSYLKPGTTPTEWTTDIPTTYYATLRVVYDSPNIDETFYSKDIHGLRLTLTFNTSNEAELRLDGTLVATSSAQGVGTWNSVLMEVKHPYAVTWADQSQWNTVWAGHPYLLAHAWGNAGPTMSALQSKKLEEINASSSPTSEETTGQALAIA